MLSTRFWTAVLTLNFLLFACVEQTKPEPDMARLWSKLHRQSVIGVIAPDSLMPFLEPLKRSLRAQSLNRMSADRMSAVSSIPLIRVVRPTETGTKYPVTTHLEAHPQNMETPVLVITIADSLPVLDLPKLTMIAGYQAFDRHGLKAYGYPETVADQPPSRVRELMLVEIPSRFGFRIKASTTLTMRRIDSVASHIQGILGRVDSLLGKQSNLSEVRMYDSTELKGMMTGNTRIEHVDGPIYHIAASRLTRYMPVGRDLAESQLPSDLKSHRMAVAAYLAGVFEYDFKPLAKRMILSQSTTIDEILNPEIHRYISPFVRHAVLAAYVDYFFSTRGELPDEKALRAIHLADLSAFIRQQYPSFPRQQRIVLSDDRGFCFAHEGYRIYNSYGSLQARIMLERLRALGSNAVSVTPFTFMRDKHQPSPFQISRWAGSETDENVMQTILDAHDLGLRVQLKPHVWLRGSWCGEIEMKNEVDWKQWFTHYNRWLQHYAVMAQIMGVEQLVSGVELVKTTLAKPQSWEQTIQSLKMIYDGPVGYAANWGLEFDSLKFSQSLDFIGLNWYYPLSDQVNPTNAALQAVVRDLMADVTRVQQRSGKPLILTEIGFTSTRTPWLRPHDDGFRVTPDGLAQARLFDVFFDQYHSTEFSGLYIWKWPSVLRIGGETHSSFTPHLKPAAARIKAAYSRPVRRSKR